MQEKTKKIILFYSNHLYKLLKVYFTVALCSSQIFILLYGLAELNYSMLVFSFSEILILALCILFKFHSFKTENNRIKDISEKIPQLPELSLLIPSITASSEDQEIMLGAIEGQFTGGVKRIGRIAYLNFSNINTELYAVRAVWVASASLLSTLSYFTLMIFGFSRLEGITVSFLVGGLLFPLGLLVSRWHWIRRQKRLALLADEFNVMQYYENKFKMNVANINRLPISKRDKSIRIRKAYDKKEELKAEYEKLALAKRNKVNDEQYILILQSVQSTELRLQRSRSFPELDGNPDKPEVDQLGDEVNYEKALKDRDFFEWLISEYKKEEFIRRDYIASYLDYKGVSRNLIHEIDRSYPKLLNAPALKDLIHRLGESGHFQPNDVEYLILKLSEFKNEKNLSFEKNPDNDHQKDTIGKVES